MAAKSHHFNPVVYLREFASNKKKELWEYDLTNGAVKKSTDLPPRGWTKGEGHTSAGLISAKVVKVDSANDLALLKADGKFSSLPIAASRGLRLGATVATVGFPNIGLQGFAPKVLAHGHHGGDRGVERGGG